MSKEKRKRGPIHRFKKGEPRPPGSGRQKGSTNKFTRELKEALLTAAEFVGRNGTMTKEGEEGLVGYLKRIAVKKPDIFCNMLSRLIPYQIKAQVTETHEHTHTIKYSPEDLRKLPLTELASLYREEVRAPLALEDKSRPASN